MTVASHLAAFFAGFVACALFVGARRHRGLDLPNIKEPRR
jgi:hypothetical protein